MTNYENLIVTALKAQWTAASTDYKTPEVVEITEAGRRIDVANGDYILIPPIISNKMPMSLGYTHRSVIGEVTVDIRTGISKAHLIKLVDEVDRIMMLYRKNSKSTIGWDLIGKADRNDLSNKMKLLWRVILTYNAAIFAESI